MELIVVLIVILAVVFINVVNKSKGNNNSAGIAKETKEISVQEKNALFSDEEIMKSVEFQQTLQKAKDTMKWMTFAVGTDPILPPLIKKPFDQPYNIIFEKQGYDLWTEHYKQYVNGTVWAEREKALNAFCVDLFEDHAEEMEKIISIEYIADYLIEFEDISGYDSDFILRYTLQIHWQPEWGTPQRYVRELR